MGITFHWFKGYTVNKTNCEYDDLIFSKDSDNTGHGNKASLDIYLMFKDIGHEFPTFDTIYFKEKYLSSLIPPIKMAKLCDELLQKEDIIKKYDIDLKERIEWFKELSEEGYYLLYDVD